MSDDDTVVVDGLRKIFEGPDGGMVAAVDGASMTIRAGELTAPACPDEAGKTTLMRMFAGLPKPDAGSLRVLGIDVVQDAQSGERRSSTDLYLTLTIRAPTQIKSGFLQFPSVPHGPCNNVSDR